MSAPPVGGEKERGVARGRRRLVRRTAVGGPEEKLGVVDLPPGRGAADLTDRLRDVPHPEHVPLGEKPAVGVRGQAPAEAQAAALDEAGSFAALAEAERLQIVQNQRREAVVK